MSIHSTGFGDDEKRLVTSPKGAAEALDCGITHVYELLKNGQLVSFKDGSARKITIESIKAYLQRRLADAKANPANHQPRPFVPPRKGREAEPPAAG